MNFHTRTFLDYASFTKRLDSNLKRWAKDCMAIEAEMSRADAVMEIHALLRTKVHLWLQRNKLKNEMVEIIDTVELKKVEWMHVARRYGA